MIIIATSKAPITRVINFLFKLTPPFIANYFFAAAISTAIFNQAGLKRRTTTENRLG
jgi:hypothetical protein